MLVWLSSAVLAGPLVAIVVVDESARQEGFALELEDLVVEDALPIDVAEGEHVRIVDPDGRRHDLDVAPGEAWEVTGARGEAWMSKLGEDVRTDVLMVRGDEDAVLSLARALHAVVRKDGDQVLLVRHDILFDAPWAKIKEVDRLDAVGLVRVDAGEPQRKSVAVSRAPLVPATPAIAPVVDKVSVTVVAKPEVAVQPAPKGIADAVADVAVPDVPVVAAPVATERFGAADPLDKAAYVGLYACADGTPVLLDPSGSFLHPRVAGEWYVSAPGVVRLLVEGAMWGRVAIESERHFCRAVW